MITILTLLLQAGKDVMLLIPWPSQSDDNIMSSKLIGDFIGDLLQLVKYVVPPWEEEASYEVVANSGAFDDKASLEDAMLNFFSDTVAASTSTSSAGPPCPSGVGVQASRCPRGMEPERHQLGTPSNHENITSTHGCGSDP